MRRRVMIIGGGASGLACAVSAARAGAAVSVLEQTGRVGKKLLSTGNGRCNLTNLSMPGGAYRSDNPGFAGEVLAGFTVRDTLEFFGDLGLLFCDREGYIYPRSGQASSVLEALEAEAGHLGVNIACDCRVQEILPRGEDGRGKKGPPFWIRTSRGDFPADAAVLAAGSRAAPGTGSDGSGYELAGRLGHRIIKPLPALVQLKCRETYWKRAAGVRTEASVSLFADGKEKARDRGELQIADYGISGIPVFQVSRYASRALDAGQRVTARLDFLPDMGRERVFGFLKARTERLGYRKAADFLTGVLNKKLAHLLLSLSKIPPDSVSRDISPGQLKCLTGLIKSLETEIAAVNSYEKAQVCCGGADTRQVRPETMESRLVRGLYLVGELLDVDGICGGYNLQWAWSTGVIAGRAAALGPGGALGKGAGRRGASGEPEPGGLRSEAKMERDYDQD